MLDILIVEDNKEIGNLLCDFLRKENYTVIVLYLSNFTTDILGMHWRMMNF
jgi:DNA-binding response OmpR family regulator